MGVTEKTWKRETEEAGGTDGGALGVTREAWKRQGRLGRKRQGKLGEGETVMGWKWMTGG